MTSADGGRTRFEHAHPILSVSSMARSLDYYVGTLGFANAEWGGDDFTCVSRDGASIYLSEGDQGQPGTWVWVGVDDVERLHEELVAGNGSAKVALLSMDRSIAAWTTIAVTTADPDATAIAHRRQALLLDVERTFPHARQFVRPGFDERS
jgi:catechol 2,3-dioxygenase-like lactoylglutathione lyase family enzyme